MIRRIHIIYYITFLVVLLAVGRYFRNILLSLPPPEALYEYSPTLSTKIYDINNNLITELSTEKRTWVPLLKIPVDLQNALIAIEDHRFFSHWGISFRGIIRAMLQNIFKRKLVAGGSTITQQLAKLAFLSREKTFSRKLKEVILALQLERNFSKQEILEMYINQVYFGHGRYGVEQAANFYFGKHANELTLSECSLLAGLVRQPHYYSPINNIARSIMRRETVLSRMYKLGFIQLNEKRNASLEPVIIKKLPVATPAPYFVEYVYLTLEPKYGSELLYNGGLSIYTTLDQRMQATAERILNETLSNFDNLRSIKESTTVAKVQGAILCLDTATGQIRVMVGGRDFRESQFNRAIQAYRQPGSAFKPIIYTAAIEHGFTPSTLLQDTPLVYVNDGRDWRLKARTTDYLATLEPKLLEDPMKVWVPENYKKKYHGNVLLRRALELSLNVCAVAILDEIGPTTAIEYARKLGIKSPLTNTLSLALGASDVTLLEIVQAFNVFANNGIRTEPYAIISVFDNKGKLLQHNRAIKEEVLSHQTSFLITDLLTGVIKYGTGHAARIVTRPCAGKTGTTNAFTDAWFIGYTPELCCGVWVGYDDKTPLGDKMTGGTLACPIWARFIQEALANEPVKDFVEPPSGLTRVRIDPQTGLLAYPTSPGYTEIFLAGTEPKEYTYEIGLSTTAIKEEGEEIDEISF